MSRTEQIKTLLIRLGYTAKEALIYIDCHTHGSSSVQTIARRVGVNRVTVHSAIEQLLEQGLLTETREGKRRQVIAQPPERLLQLIEAKEQEVQSLKFTAQGAIQLLETIPIQNSGEPSFSLYRGIDGLKHLLDETLEADGEVRVFIDIEQFVHLLSEEYLMNYYRIRSEKNITARLIWPQCDFVKKVKPNLKKFKMQIRIHPSSRGWQSGFFSWNDRVGIKSLAENRITSTIIQSEEISGFYKENIFDRLWETLPAL